MMNSTQCIVSVHGRKWFDVEMSSDNGTVVPPGGCEGRMLLYSIIGGIGMLDNGFVLLVMLLHRPMRQRFNNLYIISQSVLDLLASVSILASVPVCVISSPPQGLAGEMFCRLWKNQLFVWVFLFASTYNTVAISLDRYMAIVHSLWYKTVMRKERVCCHLVLVWVGSIGFYGSLGIMTSGLEDRQCLVWSHFPDETSLVLVSTFDFILTFPLPFLIMIIAYSKMILAMREQRKIVPASTTDGATKRNATIVKVQTNIFVTMATVSVCFVLCWVWNSIWGLVNKISGPLSRSSIIYEFTVFAVLINCTINPWIYIARYKQFQQAVRAVFKLKGRKESYSSHNNLSTLTVPDNIDEGRYIKTSSR